MYLGRVNIASVTLPLQIPMFGGHGSDGRKRSTGWPCKGSTYLWHLQGKRLYGRRSFRSVGFLAMFAILLPMFPLAF